MTKTQQAVIEQLKAAVLDRDGFRAREFKATPEVEEWETGKVFVQLKTGFERDEGTLNEIFSRETWMAVVGTHGKVELIVAPKSWEQFKGKSAWLGSHRVNVKRDACFY